MNALNNQQIDALYSSNVYMSHPVDEYAEALVNNEGYEDLSNQQVFHVVTMNDDLFHAVYDNIRSRWGDSKAQEIFWYNY